MAYNDSNRGKGRPAGTRGGVKKYPADRNFGGADRNPGGTDRKPFRGNRDGADKKPYYGGKANEDRKPHYGNKANEDRKPYRGNRDNADRKPYAAKGNAGWDRKPRQDRKKEYDRIPPRDTSVKPPQLTRRKPTARTTIRPPDWSSGAVPCGNCFAPDAPWTSCWCIAASGKAPLSCWSPRRSSRASRSWR